MVKKFIYLFLIIIFLLTSILYSSNYDINFMFPTSIKYTSSNYGYREILGKISFHDGIDFPSPYKSDVYASCSGTVIYVGFLYGYGNTVIISHNNGYKTSYSHLDSNFLVKVSEYVNIRSSYWQSWSKIFRKRYVKWIYNWSTFTFLYL